MEAGGNPPMEFWWRLTETEIADEAAARKIYEASWRLGQSGLDRPCPSPEEVEPLVVENGQNASISLRPFSGMYSTKGSTSSGLETWAISGLSEGRPLAS